MAGPTLQRRDVPPRVVWALEQSGVHPLLEGFKLMHRAIDVKKVGSWANGIKLGKAKRGGYSKFRYYSSTTSRFRLCFGLNLMPFGQEPLFVAFFVRYSSPDCSL